MPFSQLTYLNSGSILSEFQKYTGVVLAVLIQPDHVGVTTLGRMRLMTVSIRILKIYHLKNSEGFFNMY